MKFSAKMAICLSAVLGAGAAAAETVPAWKVSHLKFDFPVPENVRQIIYEGAPRHGKPTRVFAWLGLPKNCKGKVPGIVLVHGGGGTAFLKWVEEWTARGYAAIAMDTVGCRPTAKWEGRNVRKKLDGGCQEFNNYRTDVEKPDESWNFMAVEAIRRGHTILRSLPEVDPERTAVYGISWGGYLTCFAAAKDPRFKAAVSVYGCGFLKESRWTVKKATDAWFAKFDPSLALPDVKCPILFINRPDDIAYEWTSWKRSTMLPKKSYRSVPGCFGHSHTRGLRNEGVIFIDSILNKTPALPEIGPMQKKGNTVSAKFQSKVKPVKGELWWTSSPASVPEPKQKWQSKPAVIQGNTVSAELPADAREWFLNVLDGRGVAVTAIR